ncbi:MAG: beta-hydroxyacyl-ACP dehydratase [Pedosphaera sp.]|nr:beta-hydroxyacyl-ACP dehydratase [Pedosphaera sp.]
MFEFIQSIAMVPEAGKATGEAVVPSERPMLADHFPGVPILPGSLLIELAAQIAGPLAEEMVKLRYGLNRWAILGMVRDAKFIQPVPLPAGLKLTAEVRRCEAASVVLQVSVEDRGQLALRGELVMMMVETTPDWEGAIRARNERLAKWRAVR